MACLKRNPLRRELNELNNVPLGPYIDLAGNIIIESVGSKGMSAFSHGLIAAGDESTGMYGYRDITGAWAIAPKYTASGEFSEGLAAVDLTVGKAELTGFIDTSGKEVLPFKYLTTLSAFQCGLAVACEKRKRDHFFGAIDRSGDWVIEPTLRFLGSFFEGLGRFAKTGDKIGFMDTEGNVVIKERFLTVLREFTHGVAWVRDEQGDLYINKAGECIWRKK
ncbi:WG repeat-containing protein [Geomonas anaerohicana]|uniref:WG repeat-containing protein n=1 Tax=Geomonas anaerohicana TaxID=2798583 RepID=A0ABS0YGM1_9BACT|nr:WG repeat-containing protein [Geomonas anaerohicana]MBJ6751478.1 WG repeat-containing protein [Geomonas anaerohicana]